MITPRTTRLVRVPDLRAMHTAIAELTPADPFATRACAVLVPTRSAALELRRTLEVVATRNAPTRAPAAPMSPAAADETRSDALAHDRGRTAGSGLTLVLPDLLTRAEFYDRLAGPAVRLSDLEREVLFRRAAHEAVDAGIDPPVRLRPGLILAILDFYDELRRRNRTVDAFERLMVGSLEPVADVDRGADRLLALTRFLAAAFRAFERLVSAAAGDDEHALRAALLAGGAPAAYRHVIVTLADQAADPQGLWPADYDLLSRLPGLERLDVIATENLLATGYHERLHDVLPGIEETQVGIAAPVPVLVMPGVETEPTVRFWASRDREEELVSAARALKDRLASPPLLHRIALVFQRPLPYLYLARQVFADARIPYEAVDALPLAAEPFAAAMDIAFSFLASEGTRATLVELLGSPQWRFDVNGCRVGRREVAAADEVLRDVKFFGGWDRLATLAAGAVDGAEAEGDPRRARPWREAAPALRAAHEAATELRRIAEGGSASAQVEALLAFISAHEALCPPHPGTAAPSHAGPPVPWPLDRHLRARAAILGALHALREAYRTYDDRPLPVAELANTLRRWMESQTFQPRTGAAGLRLLDARAAQYADVDDLRLLGLVESDWPERGERNIFFPASLLAQLGWPAESDRLLAARARFRDLLHLPRCRVLLSTFTLEEDAIVAPSPLLEELDTSGLPLEQAPGAGFARIFQHEALAESPIVPEALDDEARGWAELRAGRSARERDVFHGITAARARTTYAVSRVERYLECPFKYFAAHVLRLPEERKEEPGLTAQERGQFVHAVFEHFFRQWQAAGYGAVTLDNVDEALRAFERVAEEHLQSLGEADRALERTHLLGSAAAPGLAERAFAFEIEDGGDVIERLLEHALEGEFVFAGSNGPRSVSLRAKADRIDLMADGTFRLIDYKLSRATKPSHALQLPVYAVSAQQRLEGRHGRTWSVGRAGYIAFKEKQAFVALGGSSTLQDAVAAGQQRFLDAVDAIERGEFPAQPDEPFMCTRCGYASVCRKDYVGDE